MTTRERPSGFRPGLPAWAWLALLAMRVTQILLALVPLALLVLAAWTWAHRRDPHVHEALHRAARRGAALRDSLGNVLR